MLVDIAMFRFLEQRFALAFLAKAETDILVCNR